MGKLTPEKKEQIYNSYLKHLSYEKTARECGVNWRTVKAVVDEKRGVGKAPVDVTTTMPTASQVPSAKDARKSASGEIFEIILNSAMAQYCANLEEYKEKFRSNGSLTIPEIKDLIDCAAIGVGGFYGEMQKEGKLVPMNWPRLVCKTCNEIVAVANPADPIGIQMLDQFNGKTHLKCGWFIEKQ